MDFSIVNNYISPLILITCLGIGYALHTLRNDILNSFIPIISATIGIGAAIGSSGTLDLPTVVTGMISGLAATGMYEAFKNMLGLPQTYATAMAIPELEYGKEINDLPRGDHFAKE